MGESRELFSYCHILKYVRIGKEGVQVSLLTSLLISIESPTLYYAIILCSFFLNSKLNLQTYLKDMTLIIINQ